MKEFLVLITAGVAAGLLTGSALAFAEGTTKERIKELKKEIKNG